MALLAVNNPTMADVSRRLDPNGRIDKVVEILSQVNELTEEGTFLEANSGTGHKTTVRTGISAPTWRQMYQFVQPTKSETAQVTDNCGQLADYSQVDKAMVDISNNAQDFRLSEDTAKIIGISESVASTTFYGDETVTPERFTGLAPRYNSLGAQNGINIIDAGGVGANNTSVWLCVWGENTMHYIYPQGTVAGVQQEDQGQRTVQGPSGGLMEAYQTYYTQQVGLSVRDWRYAVRIANIDIATLRTSAGAQALVRAMIRATERIPHLSMGRPCFYVSREARENLRLGILDKITNNLNWETVAGKKVMAFDDIPVRRTDALLSTEARVI